MFNRNKNNFFSISAYILHLIIIKNNELFSYGVDYYITFLLFFNVLLAMSLNLTNEDKKKSLVSFSFRIAQLFLSSTYFFTGFGKLLGYDWLNGSAIKKIFNNENIDFGNNYFYIVLGLSVLFLELLYPIFIFTKKTKKTFFFFIMLMHLSIFFVMKLYYFAFIMIFFNLIVFQNNLFEHLTIFYDNYCPNCTRFATIIQKFDLLKLIEIKQLRNESDTNLYPQIDLQLAKQQMASYDTKWHYGSSSIYFILVRLPLFWLFVPFFYILYLTNIGQFFYRELALKRKIIPIHCDNDVCDI